MGVSGPVCVLDRLGGRCTGEGVSERAARMHRTGGGITVHTPEIAKDDASCNNWVQPDLTPATFSTTRANGNHDVARSRRICVCGN